MIKGITKTIILLKCNKDSLFEQAIFFIKDSNELNKMDIIEEAYKIICETEDSYNKKRKWHINKNLKLFIRISLVFCFGLCLGILFTNLN